MAAHDDVRRRQGPRARCARRGEPTYFATDVAYHEDKLERGYDRLINVLGSDHHGYVARMKAAMAALGVDPDRLEIPILQFVHIVEGGERASMSKRRGDFVTLDELIGEIGVDATRWFMLARSHDSTVDLDLELAARAVRREPRLLRPVRARADRARCCAKAGEERVAAALGARAARPDELHESERELVKKLLAFPDEVAEAAERRAPHRIAAYALELAQVFTRLLPRLPGRRRRARGARGPPPAAVRRRRSGRSPGRSTCSGSRARTRCSHRRRAG